MGMKGLKFALGLITVFLLFFILRVGKDLLLPFAYALFLWYLINILSYFFHSLQVKGFHMPKAVAFILALGSIIGGSSIIINIISKNIQNIASGSRIYRDKLSVIVTRIFEMNGYEPPESLAVLVKDVDLSTMMSQVALGITSISAKAGLISIYLIFLFLEQKSFTRKLDALVPEPGRNAEALRIVKKIQADVRLYLGIKTLASVATGLISYVIMTWVGLEFASFWALLIFLLNYIPSVGSILATLFPSLLALMQFNLTAPFFIIAIGIMALQFLIGNIIEPRLTGDSLNLSPLVILFSLTFWGAMWGIPGAFLCVPITVVILIILSNFETTQPIAIMLSKDGKVSKT